MMSMASERIIEEEVMPREAALGGPEQAGEMSEKASLVDAVVICLEGHWPCQKSVGERRGRNRSPACAPGFRLRAR